MDRIIKLFQVAGVIALFLSAAFGYWTVREAAAHDILCDEDPYCHNMEYWARVAPCIVLGCHSGMSICCLDAISN